MPSRKGSPNKATAKCREAIAYIADGMADEFQKWIKSTANGDKRKGIKPDPKGAADLYLRAIEYHIPKLQRTETTVKRAPPVLDASRLTYEQREQLRELMLAAMNKQPAIESDGETYENEPLSDD